MNELFPIQDQRLFARDSVRVFWSKKSSLLSRFLMLESK